MKINLKKIFKTLVVSPILLFPIIISNSCLSNNIYAKTDISNINETFKEQRQKISNLLNSDLEMQKYIQENPIIQITCAGRVNDNSFNQMTWEAISSFSKDANINSSTYKETSSTSPAEMYRSYSDALNKGYKIWVLTGWTQESFFSNWSKIPYNRNKLSELNIKIISIDWDATNYVNPGCALALNFRTQESSFLIGYSLSEFLATKYKGDANKDKRILNTSSGADASGSTNFNYGFIEGIRAWNREQQTNDTKVLHNVYKSDGDKVFLETTYIDNNPITRNDFRLSVTGGGNQIFNGPAPTIVMPVAGDWSKTAANIIRETNNSEKQWVVGVDSNMAISYGPTYKDYFITSSEKRIGVATYKALCFLLKVSNELNDSKLFPDNSGLNWEIDNVGKIVNNEIGEPTSWNIIGGIEQEFVGASKCIISNEEISNQINEILDKTKSKFFGEQGLLRQIDPQKLHEYNELKETNYNLAVFNLSNVLYGEMTIGNKEYFNMAVDEINSWNK